MKQLIVNRSGTTPVMEEVPTEKVKVYATEAAVIADLANIAEGEIVATSDESESDTIANLKNSIDNTENDIEALQDGLAEAQSYSTDETLTGGTWIDGKPIYRKVITGLSFGNVQNNWTNLVEIANVDDLITAFVKRTFDNSVHYSMGFRYYNGYLQYFAYEGEGASGQWDFNSVIIEYTKTTD